MLEKYKPTVFLTDPVLFNNFMKKVKHSETDMWLNSKGIKRVCLSMIKNGKYRGAYFKGPAQNATSR